MVVAILQAELWIGGSQSLKDKRRILLGLKDRLHRKRNHLAIAEVGHQELHQRALIGVAVVSTEARHARSEVDRVLEELRGAGDFVLTDHRTEILGGY